LRLKESWINDLQNKLEKFLKETLKGSQNQPRLVELCTDQNDNENSQTLAKLKQQLIESEKRTMAFMRKFNKVQSDYHGLIGKYTNKISFFY
jgi:ferritin